MASQFAMLLDRHVDDWYVQVVYDHLIKIYQNCFLETSVEADEDQLQDDCPIQMW